MTLVKHRAEDLPHVDPRPTCVVCGADGPTVFTRAHCTGTAHLCDRCDALTPEQQRDELAAMWTRLADQHRRGEVTDGTVIATLTGLRPDISPHRRWALYDALDTALHVARRVGEDDGAHRDLGMTPQQAEQYAADRVAEALDELIGGAR